MNFQFKKKSSNAILLKWMANGDLGYDPTSKNMLRNEKALCYDNPLKVIMSSFVKYVEGMLEKKTKRETHYYITKWWNGTNSEDVPITTVAKTIFPSLRNINEDKSKFMGNLNNDMDFVHTIVPPQLRFDDSNINKLASGDIVLTKWLDPTHFMSPKQQTKWLKEIHAAILDGGDPDEHTKNALMDTFDEKSLWIKNDIKAAHIDLTQLSDDSSQDSDRKGNPQSKSPSKPFSSNQFSAFENICEEVE